MESSRKISEYLPPYIVIGVVLFNGWLFKRYQKDIFRSVIFLSRLVRLGMKLTFVLSTIVIKHLRKNNVLEYEGSHSFYAQVTAYSIIQYLACPYTTFLYSSVVFILSFIAADLMFVFIEIIIFLPIPIPNISSTEDYEILYTLRLIFCKSVPIRPNSSKQVSLIVYLLYKYKARHYLKMLLWFVLSLFQFHYRHGVAQFWWSLCFCMVSMQEVILLFHSAFYNSFYGILGGYETFIVPLSAAIFRFCAITYLMLRINYHYFGVTSLALIRDMSGTYNPQSKHQGLTITDLGKIFAERSETELAKVTTLFLDEDVKISREMRRVCDAILRDETKGNCSLHVFRFRRQLRVSFRRFLSQIKFELWRKIFQTRLLRRVLQVAEEK